MSVMNKNERLHALKILTGLLTQKGSLSQLMPAHEDVSAMTKEICFGVCRHYFRLEAMAEHLVNKKPKEKEVWLALLMGLYQLHWMNQPDYAVVKETVALLDKIKKTWAKGLINAVLRNFCREKERILQQLSENPLFVYGHPLWLLKRLQTDWPHQWQSIAKANHEHPPMTLRVNTQRHSRENYLQRLKDAGLEAHAHPIAKDGLVLTKACSVNDLPGFQDGEVSVQDAAAQLAADLLDLQPHLRVLDACCAPGGKACHLLERQPQLKACVALDVDERRLERVQENLTRLHLQATLLQGDAATPQHWWDGKLFDRILLDAPCSALGVIRRHADIQLLRQESEIKTIAKVQEELLNALWPLLAPGGRLVYATCSIVPEENAQQIAQFLETQKNCALLQDQYPWGQPTGYGQQIFPGEQQMDGFFYAVLIKKPS